MDRGPRHAKAGAARSTIARSLLAAAPLLTAHTAALGQPAEPAAQQPAAQPAAGPDSPAPTGHSILNPEAPPADLLADAPTTFGAQGTSWVVLGPGAGMDGEGATDLSGFAQMTWFIVQDVEFGGELAAWHFDQNGPDAAGVSLSALIRWHFVNEGRLSLFVDGGIGVLGSTDDVPDGGTDVNFLPRAGVGATYRPWDNDLRVMLGARWHHISNARSSGAEDNPSRDGAMLYLGLCIPF